MLPEAEQVARDILARLETRGLPVDLRRVVSLWEDLNINFDDIEGAGYLMNLGRAGGEILVKRDDPIERQRYTIAHELAHWVLLSDYPQIKADHQQIERWCDRFASGLLMPEPILLDYLRIGGTIGLAERIATGNRRFGVSREAFWRRIAEVTPVSLMDIATASTGITIRRRYYSSKVPTTESSGWFEEVLRLGPESKSWPSVLDKGRARCGSKLLERSDTSEIWLFCVYPRRKVEIK